MKIRKILTAVGVAAISLALSACAAEKPVQKATLTLDWTPNTNHTGVYVAQEKGFFKDEGIEMEIIQPGNSTADQLVASNKAQFGFGYQEGLTYARLEEMPLVSLAAVIQHNTSAFASPVEKGVKTPKDFEGKRYAGWGSPVEEAVIEGLMKKYGGDPKKVDILTTGATDFFATMEKSADFAWIYYGWDGIAAEIKGKELNLIMLKDEIEALDYYTPIIMTNEETLANNSDMAKRVMKAISKGYDYASKNPDESAKILIKYAPELDEKLVMESQKYLSPKYTDDASYWGEQKEVVWTRYSKWMLDEKLVDKMLDVSKAYTNDYLPKDAK